MKKKNILITGSDGRIGTFLKKKLKNEYNLIMLILKMEQLLIKIFFKKFFKKKYMQLFYLMEKIQLH